MSLQVYYLVISFVGWYWWIIGGRRKEMEKTEVSWLRAQGTEQRSQDSEQNSPFEGGKGDVTLKVTHLKLKTALILAGIFILLYFMMWLVLSRYTDSPVPGWDSFITSLSIIGTWMLARKIYEHWFLWILVNSASIVLFTTRGLYPTAILYLVYLAMSFVGLKEWKRSL
jgi:nicotinamide mononucleotide transporter PnuC